MDRPQATPPREIGREILAAGKFINLQVIRWVDPAGVERTWEVAERLERVSAAFVIAWLLPSQRLVLIKQHRPPAGGAVIEFPAGLIDGGESPERAARRELYEETGYHGAVTQVGPAAYNTPGLSSETAHQVLMEIDESAAENRSVKPDFDDGEAIETILVPREQLVAFVQRELSAGVQFDSKVLAYLAGLRALVGRGSH